MLSPSFPRAGGDGEGDEGEGAVAEPATVMT